MALQKRPPVVTIMGHVDHGKTTLLDFIRSSRITAKEAGGITQHIGAYQIDFKGEKLTFIDTPGHAAFHKMRERGATITDLVILVVAANDGVKPQTIESIRHIKKAGVPVVVAINKMDLPDVDPNVAKAGLAEHDLVVTDYGGDIETVEISALKGKGVDTLLDTLIVMADLLELKADDNAPLEAVVIEASRDPRMGSVVSVIVKQGTLSNRQEIGTDTADGKVKRLVDDIGNTLQEVKPGSPAQIVGFKELPLVGETVYDVNNMPDFDIDSDEEEPSEEETEHSNAVDFASLLEETPKLPLIIKADVHGTLEAIVQNIDEDSVDLLSSGVGEISERDLEMAETSGATIISFHTKVPNRIKKLAKNTGVRIKEYDVIYKLIEDLQKQMLKLLEPTIDEVVTGEAEILQIFEMKGERIAGCKVKTGEIKKNDMLHLKRGDEILFNPVIKMMMHGKEEIMSVKAKNECGLTFKNKKRDFKIGDIIIAYKKEEED